MNKKYSVEIKLSIFITLVSMFFGIVPSSHAQSVQTWSNPVNLSLSGAATNPSIVADKDGVLHALWTDSFSGYKYVESTDGGLTWSSPKDVKFPFNSKGTPPVLMPDSSGRIHMFWIDEKSVLVYAQATGPTFDSPASWRVRVSLDAPVYDFNAAVDGSGRVHVSYIKNPKSPSTEASGAYYVRSLDGGLSWQPKKLLYESAYFRSIDEKSAHIRVAVSSEPGNDNVYSVWDDLSQKRVYLGMSKNAGQDWEPVREIVAPDAALGFKTPFGSEITILKGNVLLTWNVGEPGVRCALYSRVSADNGANWGESTRVLAESAQCPDRSEFISVDPDYSVMLLTIQGDLSIIVWNGSEWSNPETQTGPSSISNPATFDTVILRCQHVAPFDNKLYVIGCDQGGGGDIWFVSRELDPLKDLFPLPSAWGLEKTVANISQRITSVSSVTDTAGNVHALWVQSAASETDAYEPRIEYSGWDGAEWSEPAPVITDLDGLPIHVALTIDAHQRLLLTWVNENSGDILFSWANSERANIPLEWSAPVVLPSTSELNDSPSIIVDPSDRIVVAYAVTVNENRGIYLTQSTDQGATWSPPQKAFDAVTAGWNRIDQPKLTFTSDGVLHLLFSKYSARPSQRSANLYYSQSADGGSSWSTAEAVSENSVEWSYIVSSQQGLHRFWQEKDKLVLSTYHQISTDGGATWDTPVKISNIDTIGSEPSISVDWEGKIHLLQTMFSDLEYMNEWEWSNNRWQLVEAKKIPAPAQDVLTDVHGGITSKGEFYVLLQSEFANTDQQFESTLTSLNRSLSLSTTPAPSTALINTPSASSATAESPEIQSTPTVTSPLSGLEDTSTPVSKNTVGLVLVIAIVVVILVTVIPKKKKQ